MLHSTEISHRELPGVDDLARMPRVEGDLVPVVVLRESVDARDLLLDHGHVPEGSLRFEGMQRAHNQPERLVVDRAGDDEVEPAFVGRLQPVLVDLLMGDVQMMGPVVIGEKPLSVSDLARPDRLRDRVFRRAAGTQRLAR